MADVNLQQTKGQALSEAKAELSKIQLDAFRQEFAELVDSWKSIETKAQGTAAVAGVFLAAVFAFVRDLASEPEPIQAYGLVVATVFLGLTVGAAVLALRIRKIPRPPLGKDTSKLVTDLLALEDHADLSDRLPLLYNDVSVRWAKVNADLAKANERKSTWVQVAQLLLVLAILAVIILTIESVISSLR